MSSANQPPNPFSREGSSPDDQQGGLSGGSGSEFKPDWESGASQSGEWPSYQPRPEPTVPLGDDPYGQRPTTAETYGHDQQQTSPYGSGADSPYGSPPPYPTMPAYGADQPYGSSYGGSPYEVNPYQPTFGSASPYQPDHGSSLPPYGTPATQHPQAIIALVLGILGLAVCPLIGIAAIFVGSKARKEIDASPGQFAGRGMATAGFVLGIIAAALTALVILAIILGVGGAFGA